VRPTVVQRAATVVTFDADDRVLHDVDLRLAAGRIASIGTDLAEVGDEVVDGRDLIVLPGLVNAHQHLSQVGFRSMRGLERAAIGPWLGGLTARVLDRWRAGAYGPEAVRALARAALVESLLSGVTTVADQHYHFPGHLPGHGPGSTPPLLEGVIEAAADVGVRIHAGRGTITRGRADGGGAPDEVVQSVDDVVAHSARLIAEHHDPRPDAMVRIDLAPCGVHADMPETFRELAALAAEHPGVGLHTHLYEVVDTTFAAEHLGTTPWRVLVDNGWAQERTWLAHMNDAPPHEISEFAASGVGIVHLIAPDLRMGWGCAPLRDYLEAGCRVGFGTTGSASNDGANLLGDLRVAALVHRQDPDPARWPTVHELLRLATRGSADCLGRSQLGRIEIGALADIAAWDLGSVDRVGIDDAVAGLVLTGLSDRASFVAVGGQVLVRDGRCAFSEERAVADEARRFCRADLVSSKEDR
jgi:8-oxoguanine deaminase